MDVSAPLATVPVAFFDPRSGVSALALQHVRADGRTALIYHDSPSVAATRPLLSSIAESLMAELPPGHTLGIIETSVPEHDFEPFVYARAILSRAAWPGRINAGTGRVMAAEAVAAACGIDAGEVERTEFLVLAIHRPRACAFPGFHQLPLGERAGRFLAVA
jgi:hypothetical protein